MKIQFKPNKRGWVLLLLCLLLFTYLLYRKRKKIKELAVQTINYIQEKSWDIISDRRIESLHPLVRAKAKEFIIRAEKELGIKLRVVAALRTWKEQEELYARGRTKGGKRVTNARAGESLHNYGLAIDVVEIKDGKALWENPRWSEIAALGKTIGFKWGGDWKRFRDRPHFEMKFGRSLAELQALYKEGKREGEYITLA